MGPATWGFHPRLFKGRPSRCGSLEGRPGGLERAAGGFRAPIVVGAFGSGLGLEYPKRRGRRCQAKHHRRTGRDRPDRAAFEQPGWKPRVPGPASQPKPRRAGRFPTLKLTVHQQAGPVPGVSTPGCSKAALSGRFFGWSSGGLERAVDGFKEPIVVGCIRQRPGLEYPNNAQEERQAKHHRRTGRDRPERAAFEQPGWKPRVPGPASQPKPRRAGRFPTLKLTVHQQADPGPWGFHPRPFKGRPFRAVLWGGPLEVWSGSSTDSRSRSWWVHPAAAWAGIPEECAGGDARRSAIAKLVGPPRRGGL